MYKFWLTRDERSELDKQTRIAGAERTLKSVQNNLSVVSPYLPRAMRCDARSGKLTLAQFAAALSDVKGNDAVRLAEMLRGQ